MLMTFKSAGSADLVMHEKNGKEIIALLGKPPGEMRGIITLEQLATAIATLQRAVMADKAASSAPGSAGDDPADVPAVSLAQRALPFIAMLEAAIRKGEPVIWGV